MNTMIFKGYAARIEAGQVNAMPDQPISRGRTRSYP